jgi:hypothetical protein
MIPIKNAEHYHELWENIRDNLNDADESLMAAYTICEESEFPEDILESLFKIHEYVSSNIGVRGRICATMDSEYYKE